MKTIDYYRKFLEHMNTGLHKVDYEILNESGYKPHFNFYLYILEDTFKGLTVISTVKDKYKELYTYGAFMDNNAYMVFIPYNEYTIVLDNELTLYIYTDDLPYIAFDRYQINVFLDWLDNEDLKEKITQAINFLIFNSKVLEQSNISLKDNIYTGKSTLTINKLVDSFIDAEGEYLRNNAYYDVYDVYNGLNKLFCLNINDNQIFIDKCSFGNCVGSMYYFSLDKGRDFLLIPNITASYVIFYKNNRIMHIDTSSTRFEILFKLIGREDIFTFLKSNHFFMKWS